ncbi:hypothetical protein TWF192_008623 [Orbilia oligospora]|uniref:Uncharacterized protein n=1 Tax=Orbilia oligospora TaxID=2813651 RepID=A0A6G1M357_ORBOL|nr:hypothetical protein TWF679_008121 [Orbilia oligospora]KAF3242619.1 hypothetical protein TWF192_008623 [Orbilia oligospora]
MKSSTLETELCRQKTEPPEGGASITQFGIINWKQSFQPQAIAFYGNAFCSENNLLAIVRLLDERTGAQYIDMSGPNIPPNIRSYRPLNLNQPLEDIRFIERHPTYKEAKKMLPGSIYVPHLPSDPLRSSYCVGDVVVPKWSKRYDLSSDDPTKWDVYKQAMEALRQTFNEFKRNPGEMKKLLGIKTIELPSFNSNIMAHISLNDIQGAQRTIDEFYNDMNRRLAGRSGSANLQNCIINPTGQGVPDMKDLVADPDTSQPPVGGGEITGGFDSFGNTDAGPTIFKKQKLSTQQPKVAGSVGAFPYLPSRSLPENKPESRFEIETATQFGETIPQYDQASGRGNFQRVPETFWPPQPADQLIFQLNQPFPSPNYQPYMPQFQPRYNRGPQLEHIDQTAPQNSPMKALSNKGQNPLVDLRTNNEKLLELKDIVSRYSKGPTKKKLKEEMLGRRANEGAEELESDENQLKKEIKDSLQDVLPPILNPTGEDISSRLHRKPKRPTVPVQLGKIVPQTNQATGYNPVAYNPSEYEQDFLSLISSMNWDPNDFPIYQRRFIPKEQRRVEELRGVKGQITNPEPGNQPRGSLFGNYDSIGGGKQEQGGPDIDFDALTKFLRQEDQDNLQQ